MTTRHAFAVRWPVAEARQPLYVLVPQATPGLKTMLATARLTPVDSPAWATVPAGHRAGDTIRQLAARLGIPCPQLSPDLNDQLTVPSLVCVVPVLAPLRMEASPDPHVRAISAAFAALGRDPGQVEAALGRVVAYDIGPDGL